MARFGRAPWPDLGGPHGPIWVLLLLLLLLLLVAVILRASRDGGESVETRDGEREMEGGSADGVGLCRVPDAWLALSAFRSALPDRMCVCARAFCPSRARVCVSRSERFTLSLVIME